MNSIVDKLKVAWVEEIKKTDPLYSGVCAECGAVVPPPKRFCNNTHRLLYLGKQPSMSQNTDSR